ncbi:hypothetical protein [Reinekea blandensis]|uniref:Uncharacterized protein n=1 Tax=Reinekea blandensis MED297 TaxID=314283 RepID=A4BID4_9GAMM|nr:hypothetical protein [Reinekea blandensis]EAR08141.1 hypothetical protein MED297_00595 [Reinekea sp. MED297] [Reinekea blandensis MED297]
MVIAAFIVSVLALMISAASYYHSHFHIDKKLFAYLNIGIHFFNDNKVPLTLLNAGSSDVVLLNWYLGMKALDRNGSLSRGEDKITLNPGSNSLLNPGNALSATIQLGKEYDSHTIENCAEPMPENRHKITYFLEIEWCDSSGAEFTSVIDLFDVKLNNENNITGISPIKDGEKNLYNLQK